MIQPHNKTEMIPQTEQLQQNEVGNSSDHVNISKGFQKKVYANFTKEQRQEIIKRILVDKESYHDVAAEFDMLPSTCKSIINTYQNEGRIGKKENRIRKLKKISVVFDINLNPLNPGQSTVNMTSSTEEIVEPSKKSKINEKDEEQQISDQLQINQQKAYEFVSSWLTNSTVQLQNMLLRMQSLQNPNLFTFRR